MNRGKKLKQMRKLINKYGVIDKEYDRPPDKTFPPYHKGSYFATFYSDELGVSFSVGDVDKYHVYKEIVRTIKEKIMEKEEVEINE